MLVFYNLCLFIAVGLFCPVWIPLVILRRKYRDTFLGRLFMPGLPDEMHGGGCPGRPASIWIHALSVGEVLSAEPLVMALAGRYGAQKLIFTASTRTGLDVAKRVISAHVRAVRHFPYDTLISVNRALKVIRPRQVVVVESDIWPNFLYRLHRCGIPVFLVNARLSQRSFRGYRRIDFLMAPLLSKFRRICAQTEIDRQRFRTLGVPGHRVITVGNIKFDQPSATLSVHERMRLCNMLNISAERPIWVAGSTHQGEEEALAEAHQRLCAAGLDPLLIVAPRDPGRAGHVCGLLNRAGMQALTLTEMENDARPSSAVVVDRIGLLRKLYALADVTFVGGSLVEAGGHNPLEPASEAKPILFGPHTEDFHWICRTLEDADGARRIDDSRHLAETVCELMLDKQKRAHMGQAAFRIFRKHQGAVGRTMAILETDE